jgi:hypothetical protein
MKVVESHDASTNHPVSKEQATSDLFVVACRCFFSSALVEPLESLSCLLGISNIIVVSRHDAPFRGIKITPIGSGPKPHLANTFWYLPHLLPGAPTDGRVAVQLAGRLSAELLMQ